MHISIIAMFLGGLCMMKGTIFFLQLARQPLFFRETNPQPRKHTLWQATSDFTGGQASVHRYSDLWIVNCCFLFDNGLLVQPASSS